MADPNIAHQEPFTLRAFGVVTPPPGMTIEDMDRLAGEADEKRRKAQED